MSESLAWWVVQRSKVRLMYRKRCSYLSRGRFWNALERSVLGVVPLEEEMVQQLGEDVDESAVLHMQNSCQGMCAKEKCREEQLVCSSGS